MIDVHSSPETICVDLDGTLVRSDTLIESLLQLAKYRFHYLFLLPFWLLKGRAFFKYKIAQHTDTYPELLPYNQSVIEYLQKKKKAGCELYLVTASQQKTADKIAEYLKIFDGAFGSSQEINLKGENKAAFLNERFGEKQYVYLGDSLADLKIWKHSSHAVVVGGLWLVKKLKALNIPVSQISIDRKALGSSYLKMMRVHQWVKNLLIFVPLVLSHSIFEMDKVLSAVYGFLLFSLTASGIYVFNDLLDLNNDRTHPKKSKRPFAAGDVPVLHGFIIGSLLWLISLGVSFVFFEYLFILMVGYIALNYVYSTILKRLVLIDVVVLASFYILRLIIGAVMTADELSFWLITFSLFVFFSLALAKRYIEIAHYMKDRHEIRGRGYCKQDEVITSILGVASGLVSILVMALYIHEPRTRELYEHANWLWMTIPALLYWVSRLWLLAHRNQIGDDPISFAIKDIESYLVAFVLFFSVYMAI